MSVLMASTSRIAIDFGPLTEKRGDDCCCRQQPHHRTLELVGENGENGPFRMRHERVRPMTLQPQIRFLLAEAVGEVHLFLPQHGFRWQRIGGAGWVSPQRVLHSHWLLLHFAGDSRYAS